MAESETSRTSEGGFRWCQNGLNVRRKGIGFSKSLVLVHEHVARREVRPMVPVKERRIREGRKRKGEEIVTKGGWNEVEKGG